MKPNRILGNWRRELFYMAVIVMTIILLGKKSLIAFADKQLDNNQSIVIKNPTIMVPGTNGTVNRFDGLIEALDVDQRSSVLKVTVAIDGTVTSKGSLSTSSEHPIIVIAFEDSSDNTLDSQGKWYQQALTYIQSHYTFETYNYLGHSNGGLVITSYLENFLQKKDPQLNNLITVGTPYNDTSNQYNDSVTQFTNIKQTSDILKNNLKNRQRIPSTIKMLNIAGEVKDSSSDGTVPVQSVFSGRMIYQNQITDYQELLIQKGETNHSGLIENSEVIKRLKTFFWNE